MIHFFMEEGKVYVNNHWRQLASRSWPPSRFSRLSRKTFHLEDDQLCSQCHHRTLPLSRKYQFLPVPLQHSNLLISPHVFDFQVPAKSSERKARWRAMPCDRHITRTGKRASCQRHRAAAGAVSGGLSAPGVTATQGCSWRHDEGERSQHIPLPVV